MSLPPSLGGVVAGLLSGSTCTFLLSKVIVLKINRDLLSMNGIIIFTDLNFEKE